MTLLRVDTSDGHSLLVDTDTTSILAVRKAYQLLIPVEGRRRYR